MTIPSSSLLPYLTSASTLIKALKGASDPPQSDWPSKITIAREAWESNELHVPRKSEVLREWILESWSKIPSGSKTSTLLDSAYHDLLVDVSKGSHNKPQPSLQLVTTFFKNLSSSPNRGQAIHVLPSAVVSFQLLFPSTTQLKAESWVEVWESMLGFLSIDEAELSNVRLLESLEKIVILVCEGLASSLVHSQNRKKIASSTVGSLQSLAVAIYNYPKLAEHLQALTAPLHFPLPTLQQPNPFLPILSALLPSSSSADPSSPHLTLLPHLLETLINCTQQHRYPLFTQPSSSKLPLDVFLAEKVRAAVRTALEQTTQLVNGLEDGLKSSTGQTEGFEIIWNTRFGVWTVVSSWGGYMETEQPWGDLVFAEARRAEGVLMTHGGAESVGEGLAGVVLRTLVILEGLDHAKTAVGSDVIGWCLAAPKRAHAPAQDLLSSILRYHHLTHSLHTFFEHLTASISNLFPTAQSIPLNAVIPLHNLISTGPMSSPTLGRELQAAIRSLNIGGRRSTAWAAIVDALVESVKTAQAGNEAEDSSSSKKRKRDSGSSGVSAAIISIHSRLLKLVIDASRSAKEGTEEVESSFDGITNMLEGLVKPSSGDDEEVLAKKTKKAKGKEVQTSKDWSGDLVLAAKLRITRSVGLIKRDMLLPESEDVLVIKLGDFNALPEARLEIIEYVLQRLSLVFQINGAIPLWSKVFVDAVLGIVERSQDGWKLRATLSAAELGSSVWQIIADKGMVILDITSDIAQLERFSQLLISTLSGSSEAEHEITASGAAERILASSETWELPNLRTALIATLATLGESSSPKIFDLLNSSPAAFLTRQARTSLLDAAYNIDKSLEDETAGSRAMIRVWLARLAKQDGVFGPLIIDSKTIKRLTKPAKDSEPSLETTAATLDLLRAAFAHICKSPEQHVDLLKDLLDDAIKSKPFSKWAKRLRKDPAKPVALDLRAQVVLGLCNAIIVNGHLESFTAETRSQMSVLCVAMVENLQSVVTISLSPPADLIVQSGVFEAWRTVLQLRKLLSETVRPLSFGRDLFTALISSVKSGAKPEHGTLGAVALEIMALELPSSTESGAETLLAAFLVLSSVVPCVAIDAAFTSFVKSSSKETFPLLLDGVAELIQQSKGQARAALHTMTLLIGMSTEGSGKPVGRVLQPVLLAIDADIGHWTCPMVYEAVRLLDTVASERAGVLNQPTVSIIWSILLQILLPSATAPRPLQSDTKVFSLVLSTISNIIRHRTDVVISTLPQVIAVFSAIFPVFKKPRSASSGNLVQRKKITSKWPSWLSDTSDGLSEADAKQFSRLLTTLSTGKTSTSRLNRTESNNTSTTLSGPLAKQAPALLVAYVRAVADPLGGLSTEIRKELESGLWSLCEVLTVGGRVDARGREGEGLGTPFGLGEGNGGDAEKEIWAELWLNWSRRRYVGQG